MKKFPPNGEKPGVDRLGLVHVKGATGADGTTNEPEEGPKEGPRNDQGGNDDWGGSN